MQVATANSPLIQDALTIWRAGVNAVTPQSLFRHKVRCYAGKLQFDDLEVDLRNVRRLIVVGAGKASAAMARELVEQVFQPAAVTGAFPVWTGWINCPEMSAGAPIQGIELCEARPAGVNLPTLKAVVGTQRIIQLLQNADPEDLVICLVSGGGSALLVAPVEGIELADKIALAELVAAAGGNIEQLNTIRQTISSVKGGGLAAACRARRIVTLIISDVLGDPINMIASGPTYLSEQVCPNAALEVLRDLGLIDHTRLQRVVGYLRSKPRMVTWGRESAHVDHVVLGNNADAVDAAGVQAVELGYRYIMQVARKPEGDVELVADAAVAACSLIDQQPEVDCWISGGEPTVSLPDPTTGKGGRNQQLSLAVLTRLIALGWPGEMRRELVFLSGGTDGEDGPTDAAGAWIDTTTVEQLERLGLEPGNFLREANAYNFFSQVGGLIRSGATGTNVCDLRIALSSPTGRVE